MNEIVAGQQTQVAPFPSEQGNLAAQVGIASNDAVLKAFNKAGSISMCLNGDECQTASIDTTSVRSVENPYIQFDITNQSETDANIIIGSVLGLAGAAPFYGAAASAADNPAVSDQFGAGVRAIQGFSGFVNHTPVIVNGLQMISDSSVQRAQPFKYNQIAYDTTQCQVIQNTTATFTRFDSDPNVVKLGGLYSVGPMQNISIVSKAGEDMSIIIYLVASASIRNYRPMQR